MISPLHQTALETPNAIAIELTDSEGTHRDLIHNGAISYRQLSHIVSHLVDSLKSQGVSRHSCVACISRNNLEMICLYWACVDLGAIFLPISPRFPVSQVVELCQRFNVDFCWFEPSYSTSTNLGNALTNKVDNRVNNSRNSKHTAATLELALENDINSEFEKPSVDINKPLNIILTSGSSGVPKGVVHCLSNHIASASGSCENIPLTADSSWLLSLPLFHVGGLAIINRCALAGACVVLSNELPLWQQITDAEISHVSLVAAQLSQILDQHPQALDKVKALLLGGGAIEPHLVSALAERHINAYCSYGMSEMSSQITTALINPQGHLGKPLTNRQLTIKDGVIWVKGECLFLGYASEQPTDDNAQASEQLNLIKPINEQGWFNTQDLGKQDEQGNLHLLGRADNMFVCGGENIHPEEIEAALKAHPLIENAIVFAQKDKKFSLLPAAIIQLKTTSQSAELTSAQIDSFEQFVIEKIARFKRPRHYYSWPQNVLSTSLKVPRKAIIAAVKQQMSQ